MSSDSKDDWDSHWERFSESAEQNPAQRWRRGLIFDRLAARSDDKVLDIGSGQGDLARDLLSSVPGLAVAGLELGASGVAAARMKAPSASFHQIDLLGEDPVVAELDAWASHVVCSEVLEHVDEPSRLLRSGLRHARAGARVVVTVPAGPRTAFDRHIGHRRHFDRRSLEQVLSEAGLTDIHIDAAGFPFFNLYRLVVFARGRRLIDEMSSGGNGTNTRLARLVLGFFDRTIPMSMQRGRLGWQLVAVGTWSGPTERTAAR